MLRVSHAGKCCEQLEDQPLVGRSTFAAVVYEPVDHGLVPSQMILFSPYRLLTDPQPQTVSVVAGVVPPKSWIRCERIFEVVAA